MNYLCIGAGIASFGCLCPPLALRKLSGLGSLAVADEIVVDEIDHRRMRLLAHRVELGGDLLGRLQAWIAAIKPSVPACRSPSTASKVWPADAGSADGASSS